MTSMQTIAGTATEFRTPPGVASLRSQSEHENVLSESLNKGDGEALIFACVGPSDDERSAQWKTDRRHV
jgi:hypothetical protein